MVEAILKGHMPLEKPLPSSRHLAKSLSVARNTVVAVYDELCADGYIVSRERSGYFIDPAFKAQHLPSENRENKETSPQPLAPSCTVDWATKIKPQIKTNLRQNDQPSWKKMPYPFVYSQIDSQLFPIHNWRKCLREAASIPSIKDWASDSYDNDDPLLIEQIQKRILPGRGISATAQEILITVGSQQAIFLSCQLLLNRQSCIGIEDPGYLSTADTARLFTDHISPLRVDNQGIVIEEISSDCDVIYTTPSYQCPSNVTMSLPRRRSLLQTAEQNDFLIIEDDYEMEINCAAQPLPALKSLDLSDRVIYIASLSKTLAPGLRMGFIVGPKAFIEQAKQLRQLMLRHPPLNNQRAVALFILQGYHDALLSKLARTFAKRKAAMREALARYFPQQTTLVPGGTSYWLELETEIDLPQLQEQAAKKGILFNTLENYYCAQSHSRKGVKLGYSAIATEQIDTGIKALSRILATQ